MTVVCSPVDPPSQLLVLSADGPLACGNTKGAGGTVHFAKPVNQGKGTDDGSRHREDRVYRGVGESSGPPGGRGHKLEGKRWGHPWACALHQGTRRALA